MGELVQRVGRFNGWEYSEELAAGTESEAIKIPPLDQGAYVAASLIVATTGVGKIQFTTSPDDEVANDSPVWQDWPLGEVSITSSDTLVGPVTALRLARTSGTVGIEIVI